MTYGVVKWYDSKKSFGFITVQGERDVFLHYSEIPGDRTVGEGTRLKFDIEVSEKGR
ncbi:unnamed protein product, partial [marine sediment metagenome]